jgi:hypothetical protein
MKTMTAIGLGSLLLASLTAFTLAPAPAARAGSSFRADITGDVMAEASGEAVFGTVAPVDGGPGAFTLSLGAHDEHGSVLFSRASGARLSPGTYTVSAREDGTDDIRALVLTGSATSPSGVFQGRTGTLVITSVCDSVIRGSFRIAATGFLARDPEREDRPVTAAGSFVAIGR